MKRVVPLGRPAFCTPAGSPNRRHPGKLARLASHFALAALGKLDGGCFPTDVTPELLQTLEEYEMLDDDHQVAWFCELIPLLRERGRTDLVEKLEDILFT